MPEGNAQVIPTGLHIKAQGKQRATLGMLVNQVIYPGCAARPWALLLNRFAVKMCRTHFTPLAIEVLVLRACCYVEKDRKL